MKRIDDDERLNVLKKLAPLGEEIPSLKVNLEKMGYGVPRAGDLTAEEFIEGPDELAELQRYRRELAKETIGSNNRPGTFLIEGDGYVSSYLDSARRKRNELVGGWEQYRAAVGSRFKYELIPVMRRYKDSGGPDKAADLMSRRFEFEKESRQALTEDKYFGDPSYRFSLMQNIFRRVWSDCSPICFPQKMASSQCYIACAVNDEWSLAIYSERSASFWDARSCAYFFVEYYLYRGSPAEAERCSFHRSSSVIRFRLDEACSGIRVYAKAESTSDLDLVVSAHANILHLIQAPLKSCLSKENGLS